MFKFNQKFRLGFMLFGVVLLMTGCFGGLFSSPQPPTTSDPPTLLQGTLSGPAGLADGSIDVAAMGSPNLTDFIVDFTSWFGGQPVYAANTYISGEGPLANVPVAVYRLTEFLEAPDRAQVLQHATTDKDGNYSLTGVPTGVDLIVVTATVPRLSAIVPAAGNNMTADVNSATTMVAEAWAQTLRDENQSVSAAELATAVAEAKQALDALQLNDEDLLDALEELIPNKFGEGLSATPPPAFEELVDSIKRSAPGFQDTTYSVSGVVKDQYGVSQAGFEISFSGGYAPAYSDVEGRWSKNGLEGDVIISGQDTDSLTVITPPLAVSGEKHDIEIKVYAGGLNESYPAAGPYEVSGKVTLSDGTPVEDVEIEARFASKGVRTDASGEFVIAELDVLAVLVPELDGYVFSPAERTVGRETHDIHFIATPVTTEGITFADPRVEAAVRESLGLDADAPITAEAAQQVTNLGVWDGDVSSLAGLEYLVNLEELYVMGENPDLEDLSPVANLQQLEYVEVENSRIEDISALGDKPHLRKVYISGSNVSDIGPLATLANLDDLTLQNSPIGDVHALAGLSKLEVLTLRELEITELPSLQGMPVLDWLFLQGNTELGNVDPLIDTTATWIRLEDTTSLDWCSWDATWSIVDALRADGKQVNTNQHCAGPYTLFGTVTTKPGAPYQPVVEVILENPSGAGSGTWTTYTDSNGHWEQTVEGTVNLTLRVEDDQSATWHFDPAGRNHILRPVGDLDFTVSYVPQGEPLDLHLFVGLFEPAEVEVGGTRELVVETQDGDIDQAVITWDFTGGQVIETRANRVEWQAPDTPGIVTATAHVTIGARSGTAQIELTVTEPFTAHIEADRYVVNPGEAVLLTGNMTGFRASEAYAEWSAEHGTIETIDSLQAHWIAPNYSGTFTVELRGAVWLGPRSPWVSVEIEVLADPLCEGAENCAVIRTLGDLQAMRENVTAHYLLANDIDAGPTREWSSNGFEPIGTRNEPFIGTFDGRGHEIDGLYIRRGSGDLGLFGAAGETAVISDVGIINADVGGRASTMGILLGHGSGTKVVNAYSTGEVTARSGVSGGLVGQMRDGGLIEDAYSSADVVAIESGGSVGGLVALLSNGSTIRNSYSTGSVDGNGGVGGLVSSVSGNSTVVDSWSSGTVKASGENVGGLVGSLGGTLSTIEDSYSTSSVEGHGQNVGGLVGSFTGGSIIGSSSEGDVFGADYHVGGLVGYMRYEDTLIESSWSSGDVVGEDRYVGGLVGANGGFPDSQNLGGGTIRDSYSTGNVTGGAGAYVGGFIGRLTQGGIIESSSASGNVESSAGAVGGFAGLSYLHTSIVDSYSTGTVSGVGNVGGFIGINRETSTIEHSYSRGDVIGTLEGAGGFVGLNNGTIRYSNSQNDVTGVDYVGGFAGQNGVGTIAYSFSLGDVTGDREIGGLVGRQSSKAEDGLIHSYAIGAVEGDEAVGGLVGLLSSSSVTYSYFVGTVSGIEDVGGLVGRTTSSYGRPEETERSYSSVGLGVEAMKQSATYVGWNFGSVWTINEGSDYPDLIDNPR